MFPSSIFRSKILEEYIQEVNPIEDINILESFEKNGTIIIYYITDEYDKYNSYEFQRKEMFIEVTELIDFTFMKLKKLEEMLISSK